MLIVAVPSSLSVIIKLVAGTFESVTFHSNFPVMKDGVTNSSRSVVSPTCFRTPSRFSIRFGGAKPGKLGPVGNASNLKS